MVEAKDAAEAVVYSDGKMYTLLSWDDDFN